MLLEIDSSKCLLYSAGLELHNINSVMCQGVSHCVRRHLEGSWDRWRKPGKRKRATRKSEERLFSICIFLLFVCSWFRVPFVEAAYGDGVAGFTSTCLFLPRVRFLWHRWEIIFETARGEIVSWRSPSLFTMRMLTSLTVGATWMIN